MLKFIKIVIFSAGFLLMPLVSHASTLYIDPATSQYGPGDSFPIDIKINVNNTCVNTVEANIEFTKSRLELLDFITGESIINFWLDKPDKTKMARIKSDGRLYFAGGTPGGYCGKIPGDPGDSNLIARLIFKVPGFIIGDDSLDTAEIKFLNSTRVLLNDGFGTADDLSLNNASIKILKVSTGADTGWQAQIKDDIIPPEPFIVELRSTPTVYNGEYYIIFFTTDKQSGVDHYEVLELRPEEKIGEKPRRKIVDYLFRRKAEPLNWVKAEIPYLLSDQSLKSVISVKAVDKAGNERLVEFVPPKSEQIKAQSHIVNFYYALLLIAGGSLLIAIAVLAFWLAARRRKLRN